MTDTLHGDRLQLPPGQHGFSIVELMIAMVLALVLIGGVVQVITTSQGSYRDLVRQGRLQETAKLALDYMVRDLRNVGYWGCGQDTLQMANVISDSSAHGQYTYSLNTFVTAYEDPATNDNMPDYFDSADLAPGSDTLEIRVPDIDNSLNLVSFNDTGTVTLGLSDAFPGGAGDVAAIVDSRCDNVGIFAVTNTGTDTSVSPPVPLVIYDTSTSVAGGEMGNCTLALKGEFTCTNTTPSNSIDYALDSQVYPMNHFAYAVKVDADGNPSLWRLRPSGTSEELIENVTDLSIGFGLDTDGDGAVDRFVSPSDIDGATFSYDQAMVVTLQVGVRSPDSLPNQGPLQDQFSTTVRLRNRGL